MKKYIILLFLGIAITANAQNIFLEVDGILAEEENWCWAASSQCILAYYGSYNNQCEIAEYVRTSGSTFHYYGSRPCCQDPTWGCTQGVPLYRQRGSIQDILCELCDIRSLGSDPLTTDGIIDQLERKQPFVISWWQSLDHSVAHAMVGYGILSLGIFVSPRIYFVDPDKDGNDGYSNLSYDELKNNDKYEWWATLVTLSSRGAPCCCNNGEWDADKGELGVDCGDVCGNVCGSAPGDHCKNHRHDPDLGETGIDCGGPDCPECTLCNNCILDEGEDAIDCGGTCTPCMHVGGVPDEKNIINTAQLTSEVKAYKKITAGGATTVASGKDVRFVTDKTGSIVLLPGFTAESGSKFSAQLKDLSENKRLCGGSICYGHHLSSEHKAWYDYLTIYNLNYAVRIGYDIYKTVGYAPDPIYSRNFKINSNGNVYLWDCLTNAGDGLTGTIRYKIVYSIEYCNNTGIYEQSHYFNVNYPYYKSLNEDHDEAEDFDTPQSSSSDNLKIQDKKNAPSLSIIPNPNPGTFQLETNFPLSAIGNLKITNLMGATVYETQNVASNMVQLQNAASGQFFVVMILKDGAVITRKMVVQ